MNRTWASVALAVALALGLVNSQVLGRWRASQGPEYVVELIHDEESNTVQVDLTLPDGGWPTSGDGWGRARIEEGRIVGLRPAVGEAGEGDLEVWVRVRRGGVRILDERALAVGVAEAGGPGPWRARVVAVPGGALMVMGVEALR